MNSTDGRVGIRARDLPRELLDMVIDYLHADKKSLKSCSCVCKGWTLSARYHIFETIFIHLDSMSARTWSRLESLDEFLASHPEEAPFIKKFIVHGSPPSDWGGAARKPYFGLQESVVVSVVSKLLAVRSISLTCLGFYPDSTNIFSALALLPHLHSISLCDMRIYNTESSGLRIVSKTFVSQLAHISLKTNFINDSRLRNFLDVLAGRIGQLDHLVITIPSWHDMFPPLYAEILSTPSASLTYLDLDIRPWCIVHKHQFTIDQNDPLADGTDCKEQMKERLGSLPFSSLTSLVRLDLSICAFTHQYAWIATSAILDMMSRSAPLNQVVVAVDTDRTNFDSWACERTIPMFDQAAIRLPHIKKVKLIWAHWTPSNPHISVLLPALAKHMPVLEQKGILEVQGADDK